MIVWEFSHLEKKYLVIRHTRKERSLTLYENEQKEFIYLQQLKLEMKEL